VLHLWRNAQAVCFDVDCTVAAADSLDLLAEHLGIGAAAVNGSTSPEEALALRLKGINCTPRDVKDFLDKHPAEARLVPGAAELISALQARGVAVFLISAGGFRELCLPIARALGVPAKHVFANRMKWQASEGETCALLPAAACAAPPLLLWMDPLVPPLALALHALSPRKRCAVMCCGML
jgi:glycerol-3-phosphate dehydrogenase (NAD+)